MPGHPHIQQPHPSSSVAQRLKRTSFYDEFINRVHYGGTLSHPSRLGIVQIALRSNTILASFFLCVCFRTEVCMVMVWAIMVKKRHLWQETALHLVGF